MSDLISEGVVFKHPKIMWFLKKNNHQRSELFCLWSCSEGFYKGQTVTLGPIRKPNYFDKHWKTIKTTKLMRLLYE